MAKNKVTFTVEGKGKNLKRTSKDVNDLGRGAERAGRGMDNLGKMSTQTRKNLNGVAGTSSNVTKNFSKMTQGSSGLVAAYATLAGNLFAATAAFNALKNAVQLELVVKALDSVGAAAGRNLSFASAKLKEVSGDALSTEQAMRSMALGVSSGFSTEQMEKLTVVAKGASVALGRDMGDALDRLTRGTAKLEPEILDELGIMVRLDDATAEYAATIGKSADDLTQFERKQAFLNATLEQGTKKFGTLAEEMEVNDYDRLAASLNELSKTALKFVNKALLPLIDAMAKSQGVLVGVLLLFASTITKQLIPSLATLGKKTAEQAKADATEASNKLRNLKVTRNMPKAYREAARAMANGTLNSQQLQKALTSTNRSITRHQSGLSKMSIAHAGEARAYMNKWKTMQMVRKARFDMIRALQMHETVAARRRAGEALEMINQGSVIKGLMMLTRSVGMYTRATMTATAGSGLLTRAFGFMKIAGFGAQMALRGIGSALMAALGPIGLLISAGMMLYDMFKDKFVQSDPVKDEVDKIVESLSYLEDVGKKFQDKVAESGEGSADTIVAGYKALGGVFTELQSNLGSLASTQRKVNQAALDQLGKEKAEQQTVIDKIKEKQKSGRAGRRSKRQLEAAEAGLQKIQDRIDQGVKDIEKLSPESLNTVLDETISKIEDTGAFGEFAAEGIQAMDDIKKQIGVTIHTQEQLNSAIEKAKSPYMSIGQAFDSASSSLSNFRQAQNKLIGKQVTPFDPIIEGAEDMQSRLKSIETSMDNMANVGDDKRKEQKAILLDEIKNQMGLREVTGSDDLTVYIEQLKDARKTIIDHKGELDKLKAKHKAINAIHKKAGTLQSIKMQQKIETEMLQQRKDNANAVILATKAAFGVEEQGRIADQEAIAAKAVGTATEAAERNKLNRMVKKANDAELASAKAAGDLKAIQYEEDRKAATDAQAAEVVRLSKAKEIVAERRKEIDAMKNMVGEAEKLMNAQIEALNLAADQDSDGSSGPAQQVAIQQGLIGARKEMAQLEYDIKVQTIEAEFSLLEAKNKMLMAEIDFADKQGELKDGDAETLKNSVQASTDAAKRVRDLQLTGAKFQLDASKQILDNELEKSKRAARKEFANAAQGSTTGEALSNLQESFARVNEVGKKASEQAVTQITAAFAAREGVEIKDGIYQFTNEQIKRVEEAIKKNLTPESTAGANFTQDTLGTVGETTTGVETQTTAEDMWNDAPLKDKFAAVQSSMQPMINQLKQLGPEGELAAAVSQGALSIGDAWITASDKIQEGGGAMAKGAALATAAASTVGQIANIMAANSKAKIAAIDQEINAEKKRDGKSKESLAKIKALEAKKEQQKRKAFEQNKKMMMAQAVMSTAAAIMSAVAGPPGLPWSAVFGVMAAAMGAAQLAIISGMSYQGGAKGVSKPATPSKVTMGERQNRVDLAAGNNQAGELAYMRGARGTGTGASNFTPSFSGRYRATGGAAYVVGEQGPEVFVPEVPGQIVSNDDMREGGGVPINATFNINTIDASNMEQTLTSQRGNIIGMIREAANSSGESFLESVDTLALGESRGYSAN